MVNDEEYKNLSEDVYAVDSIKEQLPIREGKQVADGHFQVLEVEDNHSNGMQAMAVVPLVS